MTLIVLDCGVAKLFVVFAVSYALNNAVSTHSAPKGADYQNDLKIVCANGSSWELPAVVTV